jgi:hypothetical protein
MSGQTDVVKGRIKEAAGSPDRQRQTSRRRKDRSGGREGERGHSRCRRHGKESRKKSDRVIEASELRRRTKLFGECEPIEGETSGQCYSRLYHWLENMPQNEIASAYFGAG